MLYCIGSTLTQGMFCLGESLLLFLMLLMVVLCSVGMIYRMDPLLMPRSFCLGMTYSVVASVTSESYII